jgi:hypothetical protein
VDDQKAFEIASQNLEGFLLGVGNRAAATDWLAIVAIMGRRAAELFRNCHPGVHSKIIRANGGRLVAIYPWKKYPDEVCSAATAHDCACRLLQQVHERSICQDMPKLSAEHVPVWIERNIDELLQRFRSVDGLADRFAWQQLAAQLEIERESVKTRPPRWSKPMTRKAAIARLKELGVEVSQSTFERRLRGGTYLERGSRNERQYDLNRMPEGFEDD